MSCLIFQSISLISFAKIEVIKTYQLHIEHNVFNHNSLDSTTSYIIKQWACITGGNGDQRSKLLDIIYRDLHGAKLVDIESYNRQLVIQKTLSKSKYLSNSQSNNAFFQQRFQSAYSDSDDVVGKNLSEINTSSGYRHFKPLIQTLALDQLWNKPLFHLSSGEWQRFVIGLQTITYPDIILMDNGFKGLDKSWQIKIIELFESDTIDTPFLMFTSDSVEAIDSENHIVNIAPLTKISLNKNENSIISDDLFKFLINNNNGNNGTEQIRMEGINIQYGNTKILKDLDWKINAGERWQIKGKNGAGKSTLLSLIYGDVPQAYREAIYLFGHKKGSGHSVWEVKSKISYFSSDEFLYYRHNGNGKQVILKQLKTPYITTVLPSDQTIHQVCEYFNIVDTLDKPFKALSKIERKQLLLIGAYLKNAEILILDEPYHDFEMERIQLNNKFLDGLLNRSHRSLLFVTHLESHLPSGINREFTLG